jgi:hypothetical protein
MSSKYNKIFGHGKQHGKKNVHVNNSIKQYRPRLPLNKTTTASNGCSNSNAAQYTSVDNHFQNNNRNSSPVCTYNKQNTEPPFNSNKHQNNYVWTKNDFNNNLSFCTPKALPVNGISSSSSSSYNHSSNINTGISGMIPTNGNYNFNNGQNETRNIIKFDRPQFSRLFVLCPKNVNEKEIYATFQRFGTIEEISIVDDLSSSKEKLEKG